MSAPQSILFNSDPLAVLLAANGIRAAHAMQEGHAHAAALRQLARGMDNMINSQLLALFRDVQKDQNAVRLLLELRYDKHMSLDLQLPASCSGRRTG